MVSSVAGHDAPVKPRALARRQDTLAFAGRPDGWRDAVRQQELATASDDVRALAAVLADGSCTSGTCVFGPREALEASGLGLRIVDLIGRGE